MQKWIVLMSLIVLGFSNAAWAGPSCVKGRTLSNEDGVVGIGLMYELKLGQSICSADKKTKVQFTRVVRDTRCLSGVRCLKLSQGQATIELSVKVGKRKPFPKRLAYSIPLDVIVADTQQKTSYQRSFILDGMEYLFAELKPYPGAASSRTRPIATILVRELKFCGYGTRCVPPPSEPIRDCLAEDEVCAQVLACGQLSDGSWKLFSTPCAARCAGAKLIETDSDRCSSLGA